MEKKYFLRLIKGFEQKKQIEDKLHNALTPLGISIDGYEDPFFNTICDIIEMMIKDSDDMDKTMDALFELIYENKCYAFDEEGEKIIITSYEEFYDKFLNGSDN